MVSADTRSDSCDHGSRVDCLDSVRASTNKDNRNAEIIIKAIENNSSIDADKLAEALGKRQRTPLQVLQLRLLRGCIFTFAGIGAGIIAAIISYNLSEKTTSSIFR